MFGSASSFFSYLLSFQRLPPDDGNQKNVSVTMTLNGVFETIVGRNGEHMEAVKESLKEFIAEKMRVHKSHILNLRLRRGTYIISSLASGLCFNIKTIYPGIGFPL